MTKLYSLLIALILLCAMACTKGAEPRDIVFDRDVCARCVMQLSDPRFVTQAVHKTDGTNVVFEEIGCGLLWLNQSGWDNYTFYVTDLKSGEWVKFDNAFFTVEYLTPMAFGIAALADRNDLEEGKTLITKNEALRQVQMIFDERQKAKG